MQHPAQPVVAQLEPGQATTVELEITPDSLAFHDIDMNRVVEPGDFAIMVGTSSRDRDLQTVTLKVTVLAETERYVAKIMESRGRSLDEAGRALLRTKFTASVG